MAWTKNGRRLGQNGSVYAKWLLTKHLNEVHGSMAEKVKLGRLSTFQRGL
jgi:hypothetical protein